MNALVLRWMALPATPVWSCHSSRLGTLLPRSQSNQPTCSAGTADSSRRPVVGGIEGGMDGGAKGGGGRTGGTDGGIHGGEYGGYGSRGGGGKAGGSIMYPENSSVDVSIPTDICVISVPIGSSSDSCWSAIALKSGIIILTSIASVSESKLVSGLSVAFTEPMTVGGLHNHHP